MEGSDKKCVLIVGGAGMLGHKLYQMYQDHFEVWATLRSSFNNYEQYGIYNPDRIIDNLDVSDLEKLVQVIAKIEPDVVINCVGIIKQLREAKDPIISIKINSLFPHQLATICREAGARFIHISTDCVFSGSKGAYTERDPSDAIDLYGRTKFLGEVDQQGCLTLRTSIIGRELYTASGLVEWFLSNSSGKVKGFKKAIYTGFTTIALSNIVSDIIENHPQLSGLYQISSERIDKYNLLCLLRDAYGIQNQIESDSEISIDRSLDSTRFRSEIGFQPPDWKAMVKQMAQDSTPYDNWHR